MTLKPRFNVDIKYVVCLIAVLCMRRVQVLSLNDFSVGKPAIAMQMERNFLCQLD